MYGLVDSGCNFGQRDVAGGIIQVANDGTWNLYDLTRFVDTHPPANLVDPGDFLPDGDWYSLTSGGGKLYTANPNGGQIVELNPNTATVREVADLSTTSKTWLGPTAIAYHSGSLYVATLGPFPQDKGSQSVYKVGLDGTISTYATGLNAVTGLAFDPSGNLYALESFTGVPAPGPNAVGTGQVVRVVASGAPVTVATGLSFATGLTFGPDGSAYVSNFGYGVPNAGQIVKINVNASP
jgi:hypothetical protein